MNFLGDCRSSKPTEVNLTCENLVASISDVVRCCEPVQAKH